ncbi:hypothetical protein PSAC2689_80210 [Paraburkholderia sacchari]
MFARQRVQLRRRRQAAIEPAPLYLEVLSGIVVFLVLVGRAVCAGSFRLVIVMIVAIMVVFVTRTAAPSCTGHGNLLSRSSTTVHYLAFVFRPGHPV